MMWHFAMLPLAAQLRSPSSKLAVLRRSGVLPATVYGKRLPSLSLELDTETFLGVFKTAGQTGLVELAVGSEKYAVLIHQYAVHPISRAFLNVEFYNVLLTEKISTKIPLRLVGDAPASKLGLYLGQELHEVEIEALPQDLIAEIQVEVSNLTAAGDVITVADLKVPKTVAILSKLQETVVKVHLPQVEKVEEEDALEATVQMPEVIGKPTEEGDDTA